MVCSFPLAPLLLLLPLHLTTLLLEGAVLSLLKRTPEYLLKIYLPVFLSLLKYKDTSIDCRKSMHASGRTSLIGFFSVFSWMPHKLNMLIRYGLPSVR